MEASLPSCQEPSPHPTGQEVPETGHAAWGLHVCPTVFWSCLDLMNIPISLPVPFGRDIHALSVSHPRVSDAGDLSSVVQRGAQSFTVRPESQVRCWPLELTADCVEPWSSCGWGDRLYVRRT